MDISVERRNFAQRLQSALRQARQSPDSPSALTRNFNSRYTGQAVTVHAVRKWLVAEAIPTQDKLRTLAQWLQVPADWLRFGTQGLQSGHNMTVTVNTETQSLLMEMTHEDLRLVEDLHALQVHERHLVHEFVKLLFRSQESAKDNMQALK
jgi:hypothetical protein